MSDAKKATALSLLASDRRWWYGLELIAASQGKLYRGTLYVHLAKLEHEGFVESRRETTLLAPGQVPRRLFAITRAGVQHALRKQEV